MVMDELLRTFKALSDEHRLDMLRVLHQSELTVGELARVLDLAQSGVSRGVSQLKQAGLVRSRRKGGFTFLRLSTEHPLVAGLLEGLLSREELPPPLQDRLRRVLNERIARSRAFFDGHSERWDELRRALLDEQASSRALDALIPPGLLVADCGTGTGTMLPRLAEAGCRVIALDASLRMLTRARSRAGQLQLGQVGFVGGELERLPLASGSLDAALATLVLHHTARPAAAVAEMARVVKPGGAVVVLDLCDHEQEWLRREQADLWLGFDSEEMLGWLHGAGLRRCRYTVVGQAPVPGSGGDASLRLFLAVGRRPQDAPGRAAADEI